MRKDLLRFILVTIAITGGLLLWASTGKSSSADCEESMEECCKKKPSSPENGVWETVSGQFFTSSAL